MTPLDRSAPEVYCDEAGNSGENLLDPEQPFFVLASNDFSADEASSLLEIVRSKQSPESKFRTLKKTPSGIARLQKLLKDPRMAAERIVVNAFDKQFMVVTKMVDLIAETVFWEAGQDLYKRGANIAMSNMLSACMPAFCGRELTNRYLNSFVELVRYRTPESVEAFYKIGQEMLVNSSSSDLRNSLMVFTERNLFDVWFESIGKLPLDPAIPALFEHIASWGARTSKRFKVFCDNSKPILATKEQFAMMMAQGDEMVSVVGYDRRKFKFPLQALAIEQTDSALHSQVQIADICAGAFIHFLRCRQLNTYDDLATTVRDFCMPWVINAVFPGKEVSPEELGTASEDGKNPVDEIVRILIDRERRRPKR